MLHTDNTITSRERISFSAISWIWICVLQTTAAMSSIQNLQVLVTSSHLLEVYDHSIGMYLLGR